MKTASCFLLAVAVFGITTGCGSAVVKVGDSEKSRESPLFVAIENGDLQAVQNELLSDETRLNQPEGDLAQTPIHKALRSQQPKIVQFLIEKGADPNVRDGYGLTALTVAVDMGADTTLIELLRNSGAED